MAGEVTENNMADELNLNQAGTLPPELFAQQQALNRQQQMAAMLMQQNQQPQGQMVSGRYVPTSFFQNLQPVANMLTGAYLAKQGDTKAAELAQALREGRSKEQAAIMEKLNAGDTKGALALASGSQYGGGKDFVPALIGSVIPKTPEDVAKYNFAKAEGFKGSFNDYMNQITPAKQAELDLKRQELGLQGAKFAFEKEQAAGGAKLTETQGNATGFGVRAKEANQIATGLENQGVKVPGKTSTVVSGIAGMTPFVGDKYSEAAKSLFNVLPEAIGGLSPEQQQSAQARKNFVSAVLRKESGAAISPQEYANEERKYFPQLGDSDAVVKQKQQARESAIKALELQAGPGAKFIKEAGAPKKVVNFNDLP